MATAVPKRSEINEKDTWKLEDMYADKKEWEADIEKFQALVEKVAKLEGHIADSADNLLEVLDSCTLGEQLISKAYNYAQRLYDQDTGDSNHQAMSAKVTAVYAMAGAEVAFVDPEIIGISQETLEKFYSEKPELENYRKYIDELNRLKDHRLSAEMEKLVALTEEMSQTPSDTYSLLNNADITFPDVKDDNGEEVVLSHGRFIGLLRSPDREVRKNVFEKYYSSYKKLLNTYASLYNGQVRGQVFNARARKFNSCMEAAVLANNVSPDVYHNLINTTEKRVKSLHRYVNLRKKCLKLDELHMYDIYTPMVGDVARKYSFEEAKELALKSLLPLGEDYVKLIKEGLDNRWIDVYENQGKRSGAYSSTSYGCHPYVLMNYDETLEDVFTLVHEMGHSLHSYYSDKAQPFIYSQYKIFVAEVASTVNEVLLLEYMLSNTQDKNERAYLLNHYLDMFKGTLLRQTQFAEFELVTNKMVEDGEPLNADNLSQKYLEINKKYYGPDMISDEEISWEWARIPHFYYNFYVYQYATSFAASVDIAHKILDGNQEVKDKYMKFLASGCTASPVELLRRVGVDLEKSEPIEAAFDVMDKVLDEFEELIKKY